MKKTFEVKFDFITTLWKVVEKRNGIVYAVHLETQDIKEARLKLEELK